MFRLLFGIFLLLPSINSESSNELQDLAHHFFENLECHLNTKEFLHNVDGLPESESIIFADKQVGNFVDLIKQRQHAEKDVRPRRQVVETADNGDYNIPILEGATPIGKVPVQSPKDLRLFQQNNTWYAAGLQDNAKLTIFKHNGQEFVHLHQRKVHSAVRLGLLTVPTKGTFIVVAENTTNENFQEKPAVYLLSLNENLEKVQNLHLAYATDVSLWSDKGDIFMAIVQQYKESSCEAQSTIYKWLGGHFDIMQHINTSCAVRVTPFTIGKSRFIAVANQAADHGTTDASDTFSEIFKYDLSSAQFVSYQKIATRGANDIKFFAFRNPVGRDRPQESFIVVANKFSKDENGVIDYNVKSIVYKFVEGFFLPFQGFDLVGVTEWLPAVGTKGEFVLLAASKFDGLKTYQYNGWKFQPTRNQYTHSSFSTGIASLHSYMFNGKNVIVVANPKEDDQNIFELHFNVENQVDSHYDSLLTWCRATVKSTKDLFTNPPGTKTFRTKKQTNTKELRAVEADLSSDQNHENNLQFLELQLENQNQQLDIIESKLNATPSDVIIIPGDILARHVIVNNEILFNELISKTLNDLDVVAFLTGIVPIDRTEEKTLPRLVLETATIEHLVTAGLRSINGHAPEDLLHKNVDDLVVTDLIVNGNFWATDLQVKGLLNGLRFNSTNVLLREGDQFFIGNLTAQSVIADNVTAKFLNNLNLHTQPQHAPSAKIFNVDTLKVKQLTVAGFMNNVDLPTLNKYALKTTGNQEITGNYVFDGLTLKDFDTKKLNNFDIPEDLVRISDGEYFVHQDVQFEKDLQTADLQVTDSLNHIRVLDNGELDVLKKNSSKMQFVDGDKTIQEVELLKPMVLQGKINSESMQKLNPVAKITDPIELLGNFEISGATTVENLLSATDLGSENFSLKNLQQNGLKLTEILVPVHLNFAQQLNTDEIFADKINGIDTHGWVVNGLEDVQHVNGWKTFQGDLTITGNTNINLMNQVNVANLDENVLRIDGDQTITGKQDFKKIVAGKVKGKRITLQTVHLLEDLLTQNMEQHLGDAIIDKLSVNNLKIGNLEVQGDFNNVHFTGMLEDTLFKKAQAKVTGPKHFDNITIETLLSRKSIDMNRIPTLIKRGEAITGGATLELPEGIRVENIKFGRFINNLSAENFQNNWLTNNPTQTISGDQVFNKVMVFGNLKVDSNQINDLHLQSLVEDTVKVNEDHAFTKVTFDKDITTLEKIVLRGHIEKLDINSIVADGGEEILTDSLTFKESVTILTPAQLDATINGFNFSHLCAYSEPKENEQRKTLLLKNNAVMAKFPIIKNINGKDLKQLDSTVWYNDRPAKVNQLNAQNINFLDDVTVQGQVAETNLEWLRDNYFSKTANQTITANIHFQDGLNIKGNLYAPNASLQSVNEVNIEEFMRTAILQGWDQTFEEPLVAGALTLNDVQGDYRVNGLNLKTDVMRYDGENIVTGKMTVENVEVDVLNNQRDFKVQNVDLKEWTKDGVLKMGSYKVDGRMVFDNCTVFEQSVGLPGLLNRKEFNEDKVMLKSKAQTITGKKTFNAQQHNGPEFKDMKLKGTINGVQFSDLIKNQALKTTNNSFVNPIDFNTDLVAQNVNFDGLYQGVNISQLLDNLTTNAFVENYYENYDKLRDASRTVKKSLNNQANYLTSFRSIQTFETVLDLVPMRGTQGSLHLATLRVTEANHTQTPNYIMDFFKWVPSSGAFAIDSTLQQVTLPDAITNWAPLEYKFGSYLYVEFAFVTNGNTHLGHVLSKQNSSDYEIIASIATNGTRRVLPLFLPGTQKTCLLLVHAITDFIDIYCQGEHTMELHQRLTIVNALQVEVVDYPQRLEILAIEMNIQEVTEMSGRYERHVKHLQREKYPAVVIWTYDEHTELFTEQQRIFTSTPVSISAAKHNDNEYLAVASGHLANTMYSGQVDIKKYDPVKEQYTDYQVLRASVPLQVHLSVLPSNELLLYVLRNSPTDTLNVYDYTGIGKFASLGSISILEDCNSIHPFNYIWEDKVHMIKEHFVITKCNGVVNIIQSGFKASVL